MKTIAQKIGYLVSFLMIIIISFVLFLFTTTPGLYSAIRFANLFLPGKLSITALNGDLIDGFSFRSLSYQDTAIRYQLNEAKLKWNLRTLLRGQLDFFLSIHDLVITGKTNPKDIPPDIFRKVNLEGRLDHQEWQIQQLTFTKEQTQITLHGQFNDYAPYPLKATLSVMTPAHLPHASNGKIRVEGNYANYQWDGKFTGIMPITINGHLENGSDLTTSMHWDSLMYKSLTSIAGKLEVDGKLDHLHVSLNTLLSDPIQSTLNVDGIIKRSSVGHEIALNQTSFLTTQTGAKFKPINGKVRLFKNQWQLNSNIASKEGSLSLSGKGNFTPHLNGTIHVQGEDFQIMNTPEYRINTSPNLTLSIKKDTLDIHGEILIPSATITPINFSNTDTLTDDATFSSTKNKKENPFTTTLQLVIKLGEEIHLNLKGLKARATGEITLNQHANDPISTSGEIRLVDGYYHAYGQNLTIEQGTLLFSHTSLTNPQIQIRAIRAFNNTNERFSGSNDLFDFSADNLQEMDFSNNLTVGIEVNGHINSPKVKLFSVPSSLSQANILSMLVLGKPINQASPSGGDALMAAVSTLNLDSDSKGRQLLSQMKQNLGLDFSLQNNNQYNADTNEISDTPSLVISKKLSNRLYISYGTGIYHRDNHVLTLRYLLNKFLSIQVDSSGKTNGIDVLYTRSKD